MNAIVHSTDELPPGVIYVLKNITEDININHQNRLHPFYMVYITHEGEVVIDHLSPKNMLDKIRYLCKGKKDADKALCHYFNKETKDGKKMDRYSKLLGEAVSSIISIKENSDLDSLFKPGGTSISSSEIRGLDDFELITFIVIK